MHSKALNLSNHFFTPKPKMFLISMIFSCLEALFSGKSLKICYNKMGLSTDKLAIQYLAIYVYAINEYHEHQLKFR